VITSEVKCNQSDGNQAA